MKVGLDLVDVARVKRMMKRKQFATRLFTAAERKHCAGKRDAAMHYAGRLAAKEAVRKVVGPMDWKDVEIVPDSDGAPRVHVLKRKISERLRLDGYKGVEVSISHTRDLAAAAAVPVPSSSRWL